MIKSIILSMTILTLIFPDKTAAMQGYRKVSGQLNKKWRL